MINLIDIIKGCKQQRLKEQRLLYDHYAAVYFPICQRYCKDEQSASAALQAGFLKIFKQIKNLREDENLEAWMRRIIVHASIDQLKLDKKFSFDEVSEDHFIAPPKIDFNASSQHRFTPILNQLPNGYREVFCLRVIEEMSHKEIADQLGISESTSRTQFLKARKMIKNIIDSSQINLFKYG